MSPGDTFDQYGLTVKLVVLAKENQSSFATRHWFRFLFCGALVWWIVPSRFWLGMPAGIAEQQAVERANAAVLDVMTPIYVARQILAANRV